LREGAWQQGHACIDYQYAMSGMRRPFGEWLHGKRNARLHGKFAGR